MMPDNYFITADNCTTLLNYNIEILHRDTVFLKIIAGLLILLWLSYMYSYFKAYEKRVNDTNISR